ncbi:M16 family metallopeptidase [Kordiimonas aestuarii]|uniref:M16 family metallopeptidase n=1 Tax=Kordiimonas aestuarii TaxID=1005925 RepID=UPI0021D0FFEA|nr:pitrilysin family protein [Kordiimonas aestuarii]
MEITRLPSGLRVVSESRKSIQTVAVGVWVDIGARHEPKQLNGITHCLEHMLFKGTKKRTSRDIAFEIEAVGGHMNAYTSRDNTTYYARVMKDDMALALDLLSDIVLNSTCADVELKREKEVILQEIGQAVDTPDDIVFDHLQVAAYRDQPIGRTILGEPETVRALTRGDLQSYLKANYTAANIVISAVGNLDHDKLVGMVEEKFAALEPGTPKTAEQAVYTGGRIVEKRDLEQVHIAAAWPGCSFAHPDYYALQVYSTILGGGMSSRLFQEVREERGLAYSVYSFTSSHKDTGIFGLYAGTGPDMAKDMMPVIKGEMEAVANGPTEEEFTIARAQLKSGLMMALEATTSRMEQLGRQILVFDRILPVEEMIENVEAVAKADVAQIASKIVSSNSTSVAIIGGGDLDSITF